MRHMGPPPSSLQLLLESGRTGELRRDITGLPDGRDSGRRNWSEALRVKGHLPRHRKKAWGTTEGVPQGYKKLEARL